MTTGPGGEICTLAMTSGGSLMYLPMAVRTAASFFGWFMKAAASCTASRNAFAAAGFFATQSRRATWMMVGWFSGRKVE